MFVTIVLLAIACVDVALAFLFIVRYEKSATSILYGLFCFGIALYVAANGFGFSGLLLDGDQAERLGWVGTVILTSCFLGFTMVFPTPRKRIQDILPLILWPSALFIPAFLFTDLIVQKSHAVKYSDGWERILGPYFIIFILFFVFYWIWALINLLRNYHQTVGIQRTQLTILLVGSIVSLLFATLFDILLPSVSFARYEYIGSLMSSVWLGATTYILVKR